MRAVLSAVIFDFYGTLARWADGEASDYGAVVASYGYILDPAVLDAYYHRYDGIEHAEHSVSEDAYEAWVRERLRGLTESCGVTGTEVEVVVDALRQSDRGQMVAYPEAGATLAAVRDAGFAVGVCSNWGWELDGFLEEVGLLDYVDVGVTSARAGARKPHPSIYARSIEALGVAPGEVLFVGDSWEPDVRGPRRSGMAAVHVWRAEERAGATAPPLEPGDHRVGDLEGVLDVLEIVAHPAREGQTC
jgi:putative hydrolase of the HAD superfamily